MIDPLAFVAESHEGAVIALVGAPRTGKSRLAKEIDASGAWRRRVVFEPHGARDRLEASRGRELYPWAGTLLGVRDLLEVPEALDVDPLALVVVPEPGDGVELGADFAAVARLVWHTGDLALVAEEAALYGRHAVELVNLIATGGGHAGLRFVGISQSWTRLPIDFRRCVSHVVAWAQSEPADVIELSKKCGRRFGARVARLGLGDRPLCWRLGDAMT